jgi:hypothetical protein
MGSPMGAPGAGDKDRRGQPQWRGKVEVWLARDVPVERLSAPTSRAGATHG